MIDSADWIKAAKPFIILLVCQCIRKARRRLAERYIDTNNRCPKHGHKIVCIFTEG